MTRKQPTALLASILVVWICSAAGPSGQRAGAAYQAVKVCPLVSVAEVKKIAPWAPQLDQFATAEEETVGASGSSCNYPTVLVQVLEYRPQTIDTLRKSGPLETVAGVGEEAYARDNRGNFAEVVRQGRPAPADSAVRHRDQPDVRGGEANCHRVGQAVRVQAPVNRVTGAVSGS